MLSPSGPGPAVAVNGPDVYQGKWAVGETIQCEPIRYNTGDLCKSKSVMFLLC